ncbi:MAG: leucyl/phenylalanyl-tRNA--protein transferase [Planctomycetota bacterium]|nr:leucyl/phenylalanyl-tRNA--protein transferase [Planctomycetota bacterium]
MPAPAPHADLPPPLQAVLDGYRQGAFLMAAPTPGPTPTPAPTPTWYETDPRGIIRIDPPAYHIPRRLMRTIRSLRFEVTTDAAFSRVIRACADPRRPGSWIDPHIIAIFEALHTAGLAHSVEAWLPNTQTPASATRAPDAAAEPCEASASASPNPDAILFDHTNRRTLVGGLYGLCIGSIFCGEAMFSRPDLGGRDASKVCLARTILHLRDQGFTILDTQMHSQHLAQFGCEEIDRDTYNQILLASRDQPRPWGTRTPNQPPNS